MSLRKRASAASAVIAALAIAAPLASANAAIPSIPAPSSLPNPLAPNPNLCLQGVVDPGPFGPLGPYGPSGPYGVNGPLHGQQNPIGNAATCGGLLTYILRGGNLTSFVNGNVASLGAAPAGQ
ncbi:MAG: hypothetical protein JWN32_2777 [Solirubrobacterales bacterium]|jgi:hypothetical protein|nr:hypothetical protein [Solirubrobacterales bacterium]